MSETLFEELKRYVGFGPDDEAALRDLHASVAPDFRAIAEVFYERILMHDGARTALVGGERVVGRLKVTLVAWMDKLLKGPWDEPYYELRANIGRVHVRIGLSQHYMFGAMNVLRDELLRRIDERPDVSLQEAEKTRRALGKILDLELAIMLHTYREDLLAQQSRKERLATFGQLVGSLGHELRNPLGVIESSLYLLEGRVGGDERVSKHLGRIKEQVNIANQIITDLLDMIRDTPLTKTRLNLASVVRDAIASLHLPGVHITLEGLEELPETLGDAGQLRQVFVNLLDNAQQALGGVGDIVVRGAVVEAGVEVRVIDSGPGVDSATLQRLFEPLVTTKAKGVGLGLALVKRIVERHQGSVRYDTTGRGGACFVVRLPEA